MHTKSFRFILACAALLVPLAAHAYLSPDEALTDERFYMPPSHEEAKDRVKSQQKRSAKRRESEQEEYFAAQHPPEPTEDDFPVNDPLYELIKQGQNKESEGDLSEGEILRTARLLDRVERRQGEIYGGDRVLRGRAPMVDTGPETFVAGITMLIAAGATVGYARQLFSRKKG